MRRCSRIARNQNPVHRCLLAVAGHDAHVLVEEIPELTEHNDTNQQADNAAGPDVVVPPHGNNRACDSTNGQSN